MKESITRLIKKLIRQRLQGYKVALNHPDHSLPSNLPAEKRVAVIGAGIAGIAAASNLGERGFHVTLYEKNHFLGGKLGSWTFQSHGQLLRTEHGFHAFFRQYYNLLAFMNKIGANKYLIPIDDYLILFRDHSRQSFKDIDHTPLFNVWNLGKIGMFRFPDLILNRHNVRLLDLFRFDHSYTFKQYDSVPLSDFMQHMPEKMKRVFTSFARAFFSNPQQMSTAELIKSFHFYFLGSDHGLLYEVLNDDFEKTFLQPATTFMQRHNVTIRLNTQVDRISYNTSGFTINNEHHDYCVIAVDVKHLQSLIHNSTDLHGYHQFRHKIAQMKPTTRYAVWRIWTDRFEQDSFPFFVFTDRLQCLDSISFYHRMEHQSMTWSRENKGGIFELHCYALPDSLHTEEAIKEALLGELLYYLPELKGLQIIHEYFQLRDDFPPFGCGLYLHRPSICTEIPGLYLAGDWVKMDNCAMLMEAAYTSGSIAANYIMSREGLCENQLYGIPLRGMLA